MEWSTAERPAFCVLVEITSMRTYRWQYDNAEEVRNREKCGGGETTTRRRRRRVVEAKKSSSGWGLRSKIRRSEERRTKRRRKLRSDRHLYIPWIYKAIPSILRKEEIENSQP